MGAWVATVGVPPVCQERVLHGGSWPLWVLVFSSKAQGVGLRRKVGINTVPCLRFLQLWHFGPTGVSLCVWWDIIERSQKGDYSYRTYPQTPDGSTLAMSSLL